MPGTRLPDHGRYDYSPIGRRPLYDWPGGKRLAIYLGLNLEHFAHSEEGLALKVNPTAQAAPESQPAAPANTQVQYATVYTFVVWDHDRRATAIYPRMATREAIAKMRGKVNEETAWVVEASALDVEGFYSGSRQP